METGQIRIFRQYVLHFAFCFLSLVVGMWIVSAGGYVSIARAAQDETGHGQNGYSKNGHEGNEDGKDGYIGSEACAPCHADIYREFKKTDMGKSMVAISSIELTPALLQAMHLPATYDDTKLNRHFSAYTQDGKLYQSEFETDAAGKDVFRDTRQLGWKIGAGENGFGMLTERDGYLFQAPLSFYSKAGSWGLTPGYEFADYGFNRPILTGCIVCHSGNARPVASTNGRYESKPFSEVAIGCERCHGPGAVHAQAMQSKAGREAKEHFIVNPAHLSPELANNICMYCHQTGDVRVLQPGKSYKDFRPGQPLNDTLAILKVPPTREAPPDDDHVEHYYSMTLSKCYRASAGRLSCISCHDPHVEPEEQQAPAYFNGKCLSCHTNQSCKLPIAARQHSTPANNCIGCHMPKRDVREISHSSVTNHRILRQPGEAFPDITFQQTTASLPDLIHLNRVLGKPDVPVPGLTLLQAYGELAEYKPEYVTPYLKVLDQLGQSDPDKALVQAALGRRDLKSGDFVQAADHLRRSLELDPEQPVVAGDLADVLQKQGKGEEAIALLRKAAGQDPFNPVLQKKLVVNYIAMRQYSEAKAALEEYLKYFPQDTFMRQMLARAQASSPGR
ncbi:tetratricopeptide repeat protein [Acidicapsa ligni]|uniref:tetratricopeptide repeat protein n=1 Tax=Acidicapsa ligni TaxID=542300 RepID=UPI0021E00672|nr:tetratricopeptide repeat protein [Acidicapsa ligni]